MEPSRIGNLIHTLSFFFYVLWNKIKEKREKKNRRGAIYHKGRMSRKETRKDLFVCILFSLPTDSFIPSLAWSVGCGAADGEWELVTRLVGSRCEWMQIKREATSSNGHILLAALYIGESLKREAQSRSPGKERDHHHSYRDGGENGTWKHPPQRHYCITKKGRKKINPKQGREKIHTEKSGVGQLSITRGQSVFYKKGWRGFM